MQYFYLREKENQGGLCCSLPLVRFLRIKPCSGLRADTFPLLCTAASRLVRPFCGTQNLYTCSPDTFKCWELPTFFLRRGSHP